MATGAIAVVVALVSQGFVPALIMLGVVLLVVVAVGLRHGSEAAMVLGFAGGLLLDLVPELLVER